jgi:hypothetical protein
MGMKRMASKLAVLALLFRLAAGVQTGKAQYTTDGRAFILTSPISIVSPSNSTYSSSLLILNVTFKLLLSPSCANVSYSLDGKSNVTIPLTATHEPVEATRTYANGTTVTVNSTFMVPFTITGWAAVPDLSEGAHNITVYAKYNANNIIGLDNSIVYFTIDPNSEQSIPEFPSWTILPLLLIATLVIIVGKKRLSKIPTQQAYLEPNSRRLLKTVFFPEKLSTKKFAVTSED